jgi:G patch domain-containing protein 1
LSASKEAGIGPSASQDLAAAAEALAQLHNHQPDHQDDDDANELRTESSVTGHDQSPPPQYPVSEAPPSPRPPPFSSLYRDDSDSPSETCAQSSSGKFVAARALPSSNDEAEASGSAPAYAPLEPESSSADAARAFRVDPVAETKRALPRDTKGESSRKDDDAEPPPAYSEGDSPLLTFTYLMAAAGGAASIITQVQQGGPPVNAIGGAFPRIIYDPILSERQETNVRDRCWRRRDHCHGPSVSAAALSHLYFWEATAMSMRELTPFLGEPALFFRETSC